MWTYSSPSLRKALLLRFAELTETGKALPWILFLANEFKIVERVAILISVRYMLPSSI